MEIKLLYTYPACRFHPAKEHRSLWFFKGVSALAFIPKGEAVASQYCVNLRPEATIRL